MSLAMTEEDRDAFLADQLLEHGSITLGGARKGDESSSQRPSKEKKKPRRLGTTRGNKN